MGSPAQGGMGQGGFGGMGQGQGMGGYGGAGYGMPQQNPFMAMMQQLQRQNMGGRMGGQAGQQQQMPQNPWDPNNLGIPMVGNAGDTWARNPNGGQFYNQTLWNQMQNPQAQAGAPQANYQGDPNYSPATAPPANAWSPGGGNYGSSYMTPDPQINQTAWSPGSGMGGGNRYTLPVMPKY